VVLDRVGLKDRAFNLARTLPHGDQRKLELGMILAPDPEVLLLDEPTAGMAAEQVPELIALIQEIQKAGQDRHAGGAQHERGHERLRPHHGHASGSGAGRRHALRDRRQQEVQTAYLGGLYELNM
jgi:branched-chain amino acid transport system ATP-binding protein